MANYRERSRHEQAEFWESYEFSPFVGKSDDETGPSVELVRYVDRHDGLWVVRIFLAYCSGWHSDHSCTALMVGDPLLIECLGCLKEFTGWADDWNAVLKG